jgi:signal recognition particle GTPase
VAEVARLLKKFEKMRTMMKKMAKMNKNPSLFMQPGRAVFPNR